MQGKAWRFHLQRVWKLNRDGRLDGTPELRRTGGLIVNNRAVD